MAASYGSDYSVDSCQFPYLCTIAGQQFQYIIPYYGGQSPGVTTITPMGGSAMAFSSWTYTGPEHGPPFAQPFSVNINPPTSTTIGVYYIDYQSCTVYDSNPNAGQVCSDFYADPLYILCSLNARQCPQAEIYDDNLNIAVGASPIPSSATTAVVGQQQTLDVRYKPGTGLSGVSYSFNSSSSPSWSIDGPTIQSYDITSVAAPVPYPAPGPVTEPTPFYWVTSSDAEPYTRNVTVGGLSLSGIVSSNYTEVADLDPITAPYSVQAPSNVALQPSEFGNVTIGPTNNLSPTAIYLQLGYGDIERGISYRFSATAPANAGGFYDGTQTVTSTVSKTQPSGAVEPFGTSGVTELDACPLYDNYKDASSGVWTAMDQPGTFLANRFIRVDANENFVMTFMYKPDDSTRAAVWVPLGSVNWSWSGTALRGSTLIPWAGTVPENPTSADPTSSSPQYPTWTGTYQSLGSMCPAIP